MGQPQFRFPRRKDFLIGEGALNMMKELGHPWINQAPTTLGDALVPDEFCSVLM